MRYDRASAALAGEQAEASRHIAGDSPAVGNIAQPATPAKTAPHIAFVLQGLGAGGSEHIVSLLCNHFATLGWTVSLLAFEHRETVPYYAHHPAVRILPLGLKSAPRSPLAAVGAVLARRNSLRRAFRLLRPDLVVSFLTRTNILSLLAGAGLDIPIIISERNNPALQKAGAVWGALRRWSYPRAAGFVTMTSGAMRFFGNAVPPRTWVIPNPATAPVIAARHSDGRTISAVGRFVPQKGFDLLLDAFAKAATAIPEWRLVLWGEGPERAALETQCRKLGLTRRVDMPGVTARPGAWIEHTDLFVLSSRYEGWGLVVGEAMAAGLPVISFDCEWGPAEMIESGRSGILVPNGDVDAMAAALVDLCRNEGARAALGQAAVERMRHFEPDRVIAEWEAAIGEMLPTRCERAEQ
ncbi:MAG TPA: glycosyltransferase family 4 protein [Sphingomonas sp.]|nr:glycosyltransferase family 4 protein [Sphingomonas sp.]